MRFFLSSQGIPVNFRQQFIDLFAKPIEDVRLAYVVDAADVYTEEEKQGWYHEAITDVAATGVHYEFIRLKDFADRKQELADKLQSLDGVYVSGGNDYYLRYQMKISGFDMFICSINDKTYVYSGYSAGAIATGPTLKYLDLNGDPLMAPEKIIEGLGLIDTIIIPHWNQKIRRDYFNKVTAAYEREEWPYLTLRDDQAIKIIDGQIELLD